MLCHVGGPLSRHTLAYDVVRNRRGLSSKEHRFDSLEKYLSIFLLRTFTNSRKKYYFLWRFIETFIWNFIYNFIKILAWNFTHNTLCMISYRISYGRPYEVIVANFLWMNFQLYSSIGQAPRPVPFRCIVWWVTDALPRWWTIIEKHVGLLSSNPLKLRKI